MSIGIALLIMAISGMCFGYIGWMIGQDRAETRELNARSEVALAVVAGRHARRWPSVASMCDTSELAALYGKPYPQ